MHTVTGRGSAYARSPTPQSCLVGWWCSAGWALLLSMWIRKTVGSSLLRNVHMWGWVSELERFYTWVLLPRGMSAHVQCMSGSLTCACMHTSTPICAHIPPGEHITEKGRHAPPFASPHSAHPTCGVATFRTSHLWRRHIPHIPPVASPHSAHPTCGVATFRTSHPLRRHIPHIPPFASPHSAHPTCGVATFRRACHSMCAHGTSVYVFGGFDGVQVAHRSPHDGGGGSVWLIPHAFGGSRASR